VESLIDHPAGRRMKTVTGEFPAGALLLKWDGRDHAGRETPTEAYFYRLETVDRISTGRMVHVK
jgi:hypothetical protein